MTNLLPLFNTVLSKKTHALIYMLGYWSQKNMFKIYGVGSFVRDLILGRENRTVNLLVEGSAVDFARSLQQMLPASRLQCNEKYGTAKLSLPDEMVFDMVTARKELFAFTDTLSAQQLTLKNNLYNKNFSINTMACALNPLNFGHLYDYFGGRKDLEKGVIRVLYKLSFVDDPLRILQAVRLEQRLGFKIEEETAALLHKARARRLLKKISKEKFYNEIRLIFWEPSPLKVLIRLQELHLFEKLFPRLVLNSVTKARLQQLEQVLSQLQGKTWGTRLNRFVLFLSALFSEMSRHDIQYLSHYMRLKRNERLKINFIHQNMRPLLAQLQLPHLGPSHLYQLLKGMPTEGLVLMMASAPGPRVDERILFFQEHLCRKKPVLKMADLLEKGLKPGPLLNRLFQDLQEAVLENKIKSRKEELAFINILLEKNNCLSE